MNRLLTVLKFSPILLFVFHFASLHAQPGIIGDGFSTGWNNPSDIIYLTPSFGESYIAILKPKAVGDQYFRWVRGGIELSPSATCSINQDKNINNADVAVLKPEAENCTNSRWYVKTSSTNDNIIFKTNSGNIDEFFVARLAGTIRTVESVSHSPANVLVGQNVAVTANLSGSFGTGQVAYLRYSRDNFTTSYITTMTNTGSTCTATIPSDFNSLGNIQYYVFTSGKGIPLSDASKADFFSINLNDNEGNYFSYTIGGGTTYTWNVAGNGNWVTATNWTPSRTTPNPSDILLFNNGNNNTISNVPSETVGGLQVLNNTIVNLQSSVSSTLSLTSGVTGNDLIVTTGSELNINGTSVLSMALNSAATGSISGSMTFSNGSHSINAASSSAIVFNQGASLIQGTGFSGDIFTKTGTKDITIFASGSQFIQKAGGSPFGFSGSDSKVVFQPGSWYRFQANETPSFSGRTYSNFDFNISSGSKNGTGNNLSIDTLIITNGTLNINTTGGTTIKGSIEIASGATLTFTPSSAGTFNLSNTSPQSITNSGTFTIAANANMIIPATSSINLNSNISINGSLTVLGTLNLSNFTVSGSGNFTMDAGGSTTTTHIEGLSGNIKNTGSKTFKTDNNFTYLGSSNQTEGSIFPDTVGLITLNKSGGTVSFPKNVTIINKLSFISGNKGKISMGNNRLKISNTATSAIDRSGEGYIIGKLLRNIGSGNSTYSFPIGTDLGYTPVSIALTSASGIGDILAQSITSRHGQVGAYGLHPTDYLNRWWQLTNSSLTFASANISFNYLESDLISAATSNSLKVARYDGSAWSHPSVSTNTNSISANNMTSLGDFTAGNCNTNTAITTHPIHTTVKAGENIQLTIIATGLNLTYQWQKAGVNIANANNATLNIINATTNHAGDYTVIVTGLCGETTSHIAIVTVIPPPMNDNATAPTLLTQILSNSCSSSIAGTLYGANASNVAIPLCNGQTYSNLVDVWYRFMPNTPNPTITVNGNTNLVIQLLEPNASTSVACSDARSDNNETLNATALTAGSTYYIRILAVSPSLDATIGVFSICINGQVPPSVSQGSIGSCQDVRPVIIPGSNTNEWIHIADNANNIAASIKNENNNLGTVTARILVLSSPTLRTNDVLKFLNRDFEILPSNNTAATIRLYFTDSEIASIGVPLSDVKILRVAGGTCSATADYTGGSEIVPTTSGSNYVEFYTSGFSRFYVGVSATPLPIELQSFEGYTEGSINKLKWTVRQQINTESFIIERSAEGLKNWTEIISPIPAAGTTNVPKQYSSIDYKPLSLAYYRLKTVDFDGQIQYSKVISLQNTGKKSLAIKVYPNPIQNELKIQLETFTQQNILLTLLDIYGQTHYHRQIIASDGVHDFIIQTSNLATGIYFLKIDSHHETQIEKIVKK